MSLSRSSPPRNFSRRFLDTVVWGVREHLSCFYLSEVGFTPADRLQVCCDHTCTMAAMSWGSMARGNRRMLKREMAVKAFPAVSTLSELTPTNTANEASDTWEEQVGERKPNDRRPRVVSGCLLGAQFCHITHQSRSAAEDESRDRRQVGKLLHHDQFFAPDVLNLGLEWRLPGIELQNLEGKKSRVRQWDNLRFLFSSLAI